LGLHADQRQIKPASEVGGVAGGLKVLTFSTNEIAFPVLTLALLIQFIHEGIFYKVATNPGFPERRVYESVEWAMKAANHERKVFFCALFSRSSRF
jgi:hypothetical protein